MAPAEMSSRFRDKLYWRRVGVTWHCFKKTVDDAGKRSFVALCGRHELPKSYGGATRRPNVYLRCGRCDNLEMERRGWEESGPETETEP